MVLNDVWCVNTIGFDGSEITGTIRKNIQFLIGSEMLVTGLK